MASDRRRDTGDYYPGGMVVTRQPQTASTDWSELAKKGEDLYVYFKTDAQGRKHYKRQRLQHDEEMDDYGAIWEGDYILQDGQYVEVTGNV